MEQRPVLTANRQPARTARTSSFKSWYKLHDGNAVGKVKAFKPYHRSTSKYTTSTIQQCRTINSIVLLLLDDCVRRSLKAALPAFRPVVACYSSGVDSVDSIAAESSRLARNT